MEKDKIVEKNLASKGLRFANSLIDMIIFYCAFILFGTILGILSLVLNIDFTAMENVNSLLDRLITTCFIVIYYFVLEMLLKGRTIGKLITGTKVVSKWGEEPTSKDYLIRTISRLVPFDSLSF
ncbi:MAG: RDD family protein, partial [Prevotellaceae bacterium]|nr:RDD family protein [Prevotellaceae bacterium]